MNPQKKEETSQKAVGGVGGIGGRQGYALDVLTESRVKSRVDWASRTGARSLMMCGSGVVETL